MCVATKVCQQNQISHFWDSEDVPPILVKIREKNNPLQIFSRQTSSCDNHSDKLLHVVTCSSSSSFCDNHSAVLDNRVINFCASNFVIFQIKILVFFLF